MTKAEMLGLKFGRLTVVAAAPSNKHGQAMWECRCDCDGKIVIRLGANLRNGGTKSCGCINDEVRKSGDNSRKHGMRGEPEYQIWADIVQRCCNPSCPAYEGYGGRGIFIYPRWRESFAAFIEDVGRRPSPDLTLDRIKNDLGYFPGNVRWTTRKEQANNRRRALSVIHDLRGQQFGRLKVLSLAKSDSHRGARWWVLCDCGKSEPFTTRGESLRKGLTTSCGCAQREWAAEHFRSMNQKPR